MDPTSKVNPKLKPKLKMNLNPKLILILI